MIRLDIWYASINPSARLENHRTYTPALTSQVMETVWPAGRGTVSPSTGEGNLRKSGKSYEKNN